jgi:hypothetical protein
MITTFGTEFRESAALTAPPQSPVTHAIAKTITTVFVCFCPKRTGGKWKFAGHGLDGISIPVGFS